MDREDLDVIESDDDLDLDDDVEEEDDDDAESYVDGSDEAYQSTIIDSVEAKHEMYSKTKSTSPFLQKYEKCRVLAVRITQLQLGAPAMVDARKLKLTDERQIAERELQERVLPLIVRRKLGFGLHEDWRLEDMIII